MKTMVEMNYQTYRQNMDLIIFKKKKLEQLIIQKRRYYQEYLQAHRKYRECAEQQDKMTQELLKTIPEG